MQNFSDSPAALIIDLSRDPNSIAPPMELTTKQKQFCGLLVLGFLFAVAVLAEILFAKSWTQKLTVWEHFSVNISNVVWIHVVSALLLPFFLLGCEKSSLKLFVACLLNIGIAAFAVNFAKTRIREPRPEYIFKCGTWEKGEPLTGGHTSFGMPSGHAATTWAASTCILIVLWLAVAEDLKCCKIFLSLLTIILSLAICVGRAGLKCHSFWQLLWGGICGGIVTPLCYQGFCMFFVFIFSRSNCLAPIAMFWEFLAFPLADSLNFSS